MALTERELREQINQNIRDEEALPAPLGKFVTQHPVYRSECGLVLEVITETTLNSTDGIPGRTPGWKHVMKSRIIDPNNPPRP